jgi:dihydrofolate reductase
MPTRTQYYVAMSIDGYIADSADSQDWLAQAGSTQSSRERFGAFFDGVGAMAMGASTYEWALEHEHLLRAPDTWRRYYGDTPCWIFTNRDLPAVPGADVRFVRGDVVPVHEQMVRAADGGNVWIVGGGELAGQFADHGLLDEVLLKVAPAVVGAGVPVLPRRLPASRLELSGVEHDRRFVFLTYRVARPHEVRPL